MRCRQLLQHPSGAFRSSCLQPKSKFRRTAVQSMSAHMAQYDLGVVWLRRDLRLSDHPALTAAAQSCQWLVAVHVIADRELEPRRNQPGMTTGVPQLGPHQLRCAYTLRSVSSTMPTAT